MKKLLLLVLGATLLTGCGASEKSVVCKYEPSKTAQAKAELKYDGDKLITGMILTTSMRVPEYIFKDKTVLKEFKKTLDKSVKEFDGKGVKANYELDEKNMNALMKINVDKEGINKENAKVVGFFYTKDVNKAVKQYEEQEFKCGKVE